MNEAYAQAFTEVDEILKNIDGSLVEKIPLQLRNIITETKSNLYKFEYNKELPISKQNIKPQTRAIISLIYRSYWCSPEEKEALMKEKREELGKVSKIETYNPDDMFKTKEPVEEKKEELIVIKKENFLKRIINRIKKFFI